MGESADQGCPNGRDDSLQRLALLETSVVAAMENYPGTWGLALDDLGCQTALAVNPEYRQYPASAGKIVTVVAALREVEAQNLELDEVWDYVDGILTFSWDETADDLTELITPAAVREVLEIAGVSEASIFPPPLALGLHAPGRPRRRLVQPRRRHAPRARTHVGGSRPRRRLSLPDGLETFPTGADTPGYQLGQKAGFYVTDGVPYFFVGAGYLVPLEGEGPRFTVVLMIESMNEDVGEPQRRGVFDLILDYALDRDRS